ncbi:hypothetical protein [Pseudomonas typographi]|uniref:hypothetical protein n=1 Tax=Pseudomonas typographi TaxID=2715964 RepID=UPI001EEEF9F4|nr:hypothetical protein [Pseudomonas typographi]MBD1554138.1 hypothetical protein [Pseudomonas typographi]
MGRYRWPGAESLYEWDSGVKGGRAWVPATVFGLGLLLILVSMLGVFLGWRYISVVFVIGVLMAFAGALTDMATHRSRWIEKALIMMMAIGFLAWVVLRHWR